MGLGTQLRAAGPNAPRRGAEAQADQPHHQVDEQPQQAPPDASPDEHAHRPTAPRENQPADHATHADAGQHHDEVGAVVPGPTSGQPAGQQPDADPADERERARGVRPGEVDAASGRAPRRRRTAPASARPTARRRAPPSGRCSRLMPAALGAAPRCDALEATHHVVGEELDRPTDQQAVLLGAAGLHHDLDLAARHRRLVAEEVVVPRPLDGLRADASGHRQVGRRARPARRPSSAVRAWVTSFVRTSSGPTLPVSTNTATAGGIFSFGSSVLVHWAAAPGMPEPSGRGVKPGRQREGQPALLRGGPPGGTRSDAGSPGRSVGAVAVGADAQRRASPASTSRSRH